MIHNFDTEIAEEYGLLESILLNHIYYWTDKNRANGVNFYDGNYWTYNSTKALNGLFPYASERQIKNALRHLREEGLLATGNYNKNSYDRTLWYALTEKGLSIVQKSPMESTCADNGLTEKDSSIMQKSPMESTCTDNGLTEKDSSIMQKSPMESTCTDNGLTEKGLSIVQKSPMESTCTDNGLCEKDSSIVQKSPMESTCTDNGLCENVPPIPDIYTDNKPDIYTNKYTNNDADGVWEKTHTNAGEALETAPAEAFEAFWEHYPNKQRRYLAEQAYCSLAASGDISHSGLAECAQNYAEYVKITGSKTYFACNFLTNRVFEDYMPGKYRKPGQGAENNAKKCGFANFEQREYDYAALEKQLLGGG